MAETETLRAKLEAKLSYHRNEADRIVKLLAAITEAEKYLEEPTQTKMVLTSPVAEIPQAKPDRERIREALLKMPEHFNTPDLHNTANTDGQGPAIPRSTFAPFFSVLKRKGLVSEVQPPQGNKPGVYKRGTGTKAEQILGHLGDLNE